MTTIINSPSTPAAPENNEGNGFGFLLGSLLIIGFVSVILYFAIPAIQSMGPIQVNVPAPEVTVQTPEIVVPTDIEVKTTTE